MMSCHSVWASARRQPGVSPPQWQATRRNTNIELRPCTGKGASASAGPLRYAMLPVAGCDREPPPPSAAHPPQDKPPSNNNRMAGSQMSSRQQPAPSTA
jgi:hypothetical protein